MLDNHSGSKEKLRGCIGADPLGELAREGRLARSMSGAYDDMAELAAWAAANAPGLQTVVVRGHPYHDGGGTTVPALGIQNDRRRLVDIR